MDLDYDYTTPPSPTPPPALLSSSTGFRDGEDEPRDQYRYAARMQRNPTAGLMTASASAKRGDTPQQTSQSAAHSVPGSFKDQARPVEPDPAAPSSRSDYLPSVVKDHVRSAVVPSESEPIAVACMPVPPDADEAYAPLPPLEPPRRFNNYYDAHGRVRPPSSETTTTVGKKQEPAEDVVLPTTSGKAAGLRSERKKGNDDNEKGGETGWSKTIYLVSMAYRSRLFHGLFVRYKNCHPLTQLFSDHDCISMM